MSRSILRFDKPVLSNVWRAEDDWTGLEAKQERKKRQNRLNQRAYRIRTAPKDPESSKRRPFRVERFRIMEMPAATVSSENAPEVEPPHATTTSQVPLQTSDQISAETWVDQCGTAESPSSVTITHADALVPQDFVSRDALALLALDLGNPGSSTLSAASADHLQHLKATKGTPALETKPSNAALTILDGVLLQIKEESPFSLIKSKPLLNHFGCDVPRNRSTFSVTYSTTQALSSLDNLLINQTNFPLSSDHLLHLIHFNVFRALISNKLLLSQTTTLLHTGYNLVLPEHQNLCEGLTLVRIKNGETIPHNLYPTTNQMSIAHSSWLNMFPHPRLRDNLIRNQKEFNHRDLCNDIFGELFFKNIETSPYPNTAWAPNGSVSDIWDSWEDDITARRKGFIVWGEPWDVNGWEITPGFLNKWSWVLEGCEEIIAASNRWRAQRDEPPLEFMVGSNPIPTS